MMVFVREDCFELFTEREPKNWPKTGPSNNKKYLFNSGFAKIGEVKYFETFGMEDDFQTLLELSGSEAGYTNERMREIIFPPPVCKWEGDKDFVNLSSPVQEILRSCRFEGRYGSWKFIRWPEGLQLIAVEKNGDETFLRVTSKSSPKFYSEYASVSTSMKSEGKLGLNDPSFTSEEDHWTDMSDDPSWQWARAVCQEFDGFFDSRQD